MSGASGAVGRPTVWHVGRTGEVAGGMTQVVNGYVRWSFENVDVKVITSRDGSHGLRGLRLFLGALVASLRLKDRARDVVVVHLSQGGSFVREGLLLRLAHARGFGTVAQLHGSSFVDFAGRKPRLVATVLRAADKVLVLSEATRAEAARHTDPDTVVIVPNAVPRGTPRPKERRVVFGGAVSHRKGVDVLAQAWQRLAPEGWALDVAGPVTDPGVLPDGVPGVVAHGSLEHARLMELLEVASVAVLPSRDEAMPMFILEALARDACVVATTVGGIPAVLADGAGLLVEPGDVDGLVAALATATGSDEARAATVARGRRRFDEEFAAEAVYPQVEALWLSVLPGRAAQSSPAYQG